MAMSINTNLAANNAYRNLTGTQNDLSKSLEKLSSGLRINRAADDAAGLAISEGLKSQVGGLTVAARNAQDGISVVQTAEGSLNEVQNILQRMRDLAVQAGNDSNNADSRKAITTEVSALVNEIGRIANNTEFNGAKLLDGSKSSLSFQVGANASSDNQIAVGMSNVSAIADGLTTGTTFVVDPAAVAGDLTFTTGNGGTATVAMGAVDSARTVDAIAAALNGSGGFSAVMTASVSTTGKLVVTANDGSTVGVTGTPDGVEAGVAPTLDFSSAAGASAAITTISNQITSISTARAELGAVQNRFESVVRNIAVSTENLSAANSRIRDTDMAQEMVKFTRSNILQQAGTAMLAQANQSPQTILQLLR